MLQLRDYQIDSKTSGTSIFPSEFSHYFSHYVDIRGNAMSESDVRIEFGLVSEEDQISELCLDLCKEFNYTHKQWKNVDQFFDDEPDCRVVLYSCLDKNNKKLDETIAEFTQLVKQLCPEAYIIAIVPKQLAREKVEFLKKSGLDTIILELELVESSKLGFVASQAIRGQYIPVKESDLVVGKKLTFDLYHLMPLRNKFIKIVRIGDELKESKLEKLKSVGEFYFPREQMSDFSKYTNDIDRSDPQYQFRKTRAYFLEFSVVFLDIVNVLTDQSLTLTYEEGSALRDKCLERASELTQCLTMIEEHEIWNVVNNSLVGEFGSIERAPAVAAYVAYFGNKLDFEDLDELIFASLVADIGMVNLPSKITKKIREVKMSEFDEEELSQYRSYIRRSLECIANRKLPIEPKIRNIISKYREKNDGSGFPDSVDGIKIPEESALLHFSYNFDQATTLKLGEQRKEKEEILVHLVKEESGVNEFYSNSFLLKFMKGFPDKFGADIA